MNELLIYGGTLIDPARSFQGKADILIREGHVAAVGDTGTIEHSSAAQKLDATGLIVTPGLIDMHVHFREPGMEEEETLDSGAASAVAGGFTTVVTMPNTDPPVDNEGAVTSAIRKAKNARLANVFPAGTITAGRLGQELAEMAGMVRGGAVAFSDDGSSVPTAGVLMRALTYARMFGLPVLEHCEDASLAGSGAMNGGYVATVLGLPGSPAEAEDIIVARDCKIAKLTGGKLHIQHVSTIGAIRIIRDAKSEGINVTAEVTPHHLCLTEDAVKSYNPVFKVSPPLRTKQDVEACIQALADGTIDCIASDHAPHLTEEKEIEFADAPPGMIGLETTLGVAFTHVYHTGFIQLYRLIESMTASPAKILGWKDRGTLGIGACGDVTIMDPNLSWKVDANLFRSKSRNCPFDGMSLRGKAVATVVAGRIVYEHQ